MKKIIISTICIFCFALGSVAQTDSSKKNKYVAPWFVERFRISAGAFFPINNTVVQVSGTAAGHTAGTEINFERDLGFTKKTSTFVDDAQYRLKRRSRFDLSYYRINRTSGHTLDKDIIFKDDTFHVNTSINSFFKTNIIRFSYGYSLIEKPTFELGLLIGTHVVSSDVGLEVNGTNVGFEQQQSFGFTAPLPDLGIWGGFVFCKRWAANLEIDWLSLTVGDINGRIIGGTASVMYHVTEHFDLAAGYTGLNFKVTAVKPKAEGMFKWGYNGPSLTASYTFGKKYWTH